MKETDPYILRIANSLANAMGSATSLRRWIKTSLKVLTELETALDDQYLLRPGIDARDIIEMLEDQKIATTCKEKQ